MQTSVAGDSWLQSDVLDDLGDAVAYRRWLADLARPYLGAYPIEIGSGTGDYALEWAPGVTRFTATEADPDRFDALQRRLAGHPTIRTRWLMLPDHTRDDRHDGLQPGQHSCAVAYNIVEHITDDVAAVAAMAALVRPGGAVVVVVPAFPSAMSAFDRAIGHQRRYTRASLAGVLAGAGLTVERVRYVNPLGLVSWYVMVKALRRAPRNGPLLRIYDRTVVPVARLADRGLPMPFGQSVFAVARAPS